MARSDWAALLTDPAAEYLAHIELCRFGLQPYLPQFKKRHHTRAGQYVMRSCPLFPRYLLIPINDAHNPHVRLARGICRHKCLLADELGRPWRAPSKIIEGVKAAEASGDQDHIAEEMGDILFVMANLARKLKVDPEDALRRANAKFTRRFQYIERKLAEANRTGPQPLDDMEALWLEAKRAERK